MKITVSTALRPATKVSGSKAEPSKLMRPATPDLAETVSEPTSRWSQELSCGWKDRSPAPIPATPATRAMMAETLRTPPTTVRETFGRVPQGDY